MAKKSILCISVEDFARVLERDSAILSAMKDHCKSPTTESANRLASMIQERTKGDAIIPEAFQVVASTKTNKKILDTIKGTKKAYIDHLNKTVLQMRVTVLRHNKNFVTPIQEGTEAYSNLISLWGNVEEAYAIVGNNRIAKTLISFSEVYVETIFQQARHGKQKFNLTLLLDENARQSTLVALQDKLELITNKYQPQIKAMIAEFIKVTGRNIDAISSKPEIASKFILAQKRMIEFGGEEYFLKNHLKWIHAQCFYHHEHFGNDVEIMREVGYVSGNESLTRFEDYLANLARVKEKEIEPKGVTLHQLKKRF